MPDHPLHAWVDESIHVDQRLYLFGAVIAPSDQQWLDACRDQLRTLLRHRRDHLHWRAEESYDRSAIAAMIGRLPLTNVVVTATGIDPRRQERARRKCLEQLLQRLDGAGVEHLWLESRNHDDRRDLQYVNALRIRGQLPDRVRIDHARPREEPLLWIADAVVGAVRAAYGGIPRYRALLEHRLEEHRFPL